MNFIKNLLGIDRKTALEAYRQGIHYYNKLNYPKAIEYFEAAIAGNALANSLESNLARFYSSRSYINVGITNFAKNKSQEALSFFQKAIQLNPEDPDLNYFIGICQNNVGDYQGAMESFTKILETEPWNIPTKLKMAIIFHNLKMWDSAEEIHRSILKKNPGFADVHYHLGLSLMSQGKTKEAAASFEQALKINPNYTGARLKLGIVQICMSEYDKAFNTLNCINKKHPEYADVHYLIALIKEKTNAPEEAIEYLNKALRISPKYKNAQVKLIISHCQAGDMTAAENQVEKALEFYPEDKRLLSIQKSLIFFNPEFKDGSDLFNSPTLGLEDERLIKELRHEFHKDLDIMPNFSEIITMFNSSRYTQKDSSIAEFIIPFIIEQINQNPRYPDLYNSLGTQLLLKKKYMEAENAFTKALELNPDYVVARINLMKTLFSHGKNQEAYEHGKILVPKNLPFPDVYYTLTEVLINLKQYDEALVNAQRVRRLRPGMNNVKLLMAQIYEGQGKDEAATAMVKEFQEGPVEPLMADKEKQLFKKNRS